MRQALPNDLLLRPSCYGLAEYRQMSVAYHTVVQLPPIRLARSRKMETVARVIGGLSLSGFRPWYEIIKLHFNIE